MTLMLVGPSLLEVWTTDGLLGLIENTPENYAEWVRCCCGSPGCCCPAPECIVITFVQLSGPPCPALDGFEYTLNAVPLEPGQECYDRYNGDLVDVGSGTLQMELACRGVPPKYWLTELRAPFPFIHVPGEIENGDFESEDGGSCGPFAFDFICEVRNGAATICDNETTSVQRFRMEARECDGQ